MPEISVPRWIGSLVTALDTEDIVPSDFRVLRNFYYDLSGFPVVRGGRRFLNTVQFTESAVPQPVRGLYHFTSGWIAGIPRDWIVAYAGTKMYRADQDGVFTTLASDLPADATPTFCTLRGWMIVAMGSEKQTRPMFWNGAAPQLSELTRAPGASLVASHAGRLWIVERDYPSRLWYSEPYEPNGWDMALGAGFLTIGPGDGSDVSALVPGYAGEMLVFKDGAQGGSIYRLQGLGPPFQVTPLTTSVGAASPRCATMIGDRDIYFASRRGIHGLRRTFEHGDLNTAFIDREIADVWRSVPDHRKRTAIAVDDYAHDTWWLFLDTDNDGVNDTAYLWNYQFAGPRGNPKISSMDYGAESACMFREVRGGRDILITGGSDGWIRMEHQAESKDQTDSGAEDIAWEAELATIDLGSPTRTKAWIMWNVTHDNWGYGELLATWFGDNRAPKMQELTLNPAGAPLPFMEARVGEFRGFPPKFRSLSQVHLHEGGVGIKLKLSGDHGRIRLRGFTLLAQERRKDPTGGAGFAYTQTRRTQAGPEG